MALRDQPYLPLYVQDFLTDERLIECSAKATGVYIRLMCIMHKSDEYGKILLKQKDKQTDKQVKNFASKLAKQMPYSVDTIDESLTELLNEGVLTIDGDYLCQKRMIKDNLISSVRSKAGKKGGDFAQAKLKANPQANPEYENEIQLGRALCKIFGKEYQPVKERMPAMANWYKDIDIQAQEILSVWSRDEAIRQIDAYLKHCGNTNRKLIGTAHKVAATLLSADWIQLTGGKSTPKVNPYEKAEENFKNWTQQAFKDFYAKRIETDAEFRKHFRLEPQNGKPMGS